MIKGFWYLENRRKEALGASGSSGPGNLITEERTTEKEETYEGNTRPNTGPSQLMTLLRAGLYLNNNKI